MAGVKQHILPRFLQKGFASKVVKKTERQNIVFTWVYRKGVEPFETTIENIGVEKHFYGKEGELNVDDAITDIEPEFAALLDELRGKDDGYKILVLKIADFIGHLSIRTKHLRDSLIDMAEVSTSIMSDFLADYKKLRLWILEYYKRHPELIRKTFDDELNKMSLSRVQKLRIRESMSLLLRPERIVEEMDKGKSEYEPMFTGMRAMLLARIPTIAREGHIKALAKGLLPEPRMEDYRSLHWFVCKSSEPLILGDVGCLFEIAGPKQFMTLTGKDDEVKAIYLPISSDTLIVGTHSPTTPRIDFKAMNETFAKYSRDFFICRESSPEVRNLHTLLGTKAELFSEEEIEQMLMEGINES